MICMACHGYTGWRHICRLRIFAMLLLVTLLFTGCTSHTSYGPCIGINGRENPKLEYHYSALNIFLGVLFVQTIIVPLFVVLKQLKCPVGPNSDGKPTT